jgi:hypothetical protein
MICANAVRTGSPTDCVLLRDATASGANSKGTAEISIERRFMDRPAKGPNGPNLAEAFRKWQQQLHE